MGNTSLQISYYIRSDGTMRRFSLHLLSLVAATVAVFGFSIADTYASTLYGVASHDEKYNGGTDWQDAITGLSGTAAYVSVWVYCNAGGDVWEDYANGTASFVSLRDNDLGTTRGKFGAQNDINLSAGWQEVVLTHITTGDGDLADVTEIFVEQGADINTGACDTSAAGGFGRSTSNQYTGQSGSAGSGKDLSFGLADSGGFASAPVISSVVADPTTVSVTVTWDTDVASTSELRLGLTSSYTDSDIDYDDVTEHSLTLLTSGYLTPGTTYHYQVCSVNDIGETCTTDATFVTDSEPGAAVDTSFIQPQANGFWTWIALDATSGTINIVSTSTDEENTVFDVRLCETTQFNGTSLLPVVGDDAFSFSYHNEPGTYQLEDGRVGFSGLLVYDAADYFCVRARSSNDEGATYGEYSDAVFYARARTYSAGSFFDAVGATLTAIYAEEDTSVCDDEGADIPEAIKNFVSCTKKILTNWFNPFKLGKAAVEVISTAVVALFDTWPVGYIKQLNFAFFGGMSAGATAGTCELPDIGGGEGQMVLGDYSLCDGVADHLGDMGLWLVIGMLVFVLLGLVMVLAKI